MSTTLSYGKQPQSDAQPELRVTFEAACRRAFLDFTVEMSAPEGSTNGGTWVLQSIRIVSKDGLSLGVGAVSTNESTAELRTLGYTLARSKQRFGAEFRIPPREYARFLEVASKVLTDHGLFVSIVERSTSQPSLAQAAKSK